MGGFYLLGSADVDTSPFWGWTSVWWYMLPLKKLASVGKVSLLPFSMQKGTYILQRTHYSYDVKRTSIFCKSRVMSIATRGWCSTCRVEPMQMLAGFGGKIRIAQGYCCSSVASCNVASWLMFPQKMGDSFIPQNDPTATFNDKDDKLDKVKHLPITTFINLQWSNIRQMIRILLELRMPLRPEWLFVRCSCSIHQRNHTPNRPVIFLPFFCLYGRANSNCFFSKPKWWLLKSRCLLVNPELCLLNHLCCCPFSWFLDPQIAFL